MKTCKYCRGEIGGLRREMRALATQFKNLKQKVRGEHKKYEKIWHSFYDYKRKSKRYRMRLVDKLLEKDNTHIRYARAHLKKYESVFRSIGNGLSPLKGPNGRKGLVFLSPQEKSALFYLLRRREKGKNKKRPVSAEE